MHRGACDRRCSVPHATLVCPPQWRLEPRNGGAGSVCPRFVVNLGLSRPVAFLTCSGPRSSGGGIQARRVRPHSPANSNKPRRRSRRWQRVGSSLANPIPLLHDRCFLWRCVLPSACSVQLHPLLHCFGRLKRPLASIRTVSRCRPLRARCWCPQADCLCPAFTGLHTFRMT